MDQSSGMQSEKNLTSIKKKEIIKSQEELDNTIVDDNDIPKDKKYQLQINLRSKRDMCFSLSPHIYIGKFS